ncbi:MAG: hypothetical protein CMF26_07120 [Kiloniella sp.]|nr:hypothetical protein [Kiloniella sp.]
MRTILFLLDFLIGGVLRRVRTLVPLALFVMLLGFDASALGLGRRLAFLPDFAFATILFWLIRHPALMPVPVVFVIGFWTDALMGAPMGLSIIAYLTVFYIVSNLRPEISALGFMGRWGVATLSILAYFGCQWAFYSAFVLELAPPLQSMTRAGMTALTFPLVYGVNHLVFAFLWGRGPQLEDPIYDGA